MFASYAIVGWCITEYLPVLVFSGPVEVDTEEGVVKRVGRLSVVVCERLIAQDRSCRKTLMREG